MEVDLDAVDAEVQGGADAGECVFGRVAAAGGVGNDEGSHEGSIGRGGRKEEGGRGKGKR